MMLDGALRAAEFFRDLMVAQAVGDAPQYLDFAAGETKRVRSRGGIGAAARPWQELLGADLAGQPPCGALGGRGAKLLENRHGSGEGIADRG